MSERLMSTNSCMVEEERAVNQLHVYMLNVLGSRGEKDSWKKGFIFWISGFQGRREGKGLHPLNQHYLLICSIHFSQEVFGHNSVDRALR